MHMPLTTKQERVYSEIKKRIRGGDSPTIDELRKALKFKSLRTVVQYLEVLERKGYIVRRKNAKRNIELRSEDSASHTVSVPVVANVGCDDLTLFAQEEQDEFLEVDKAIVEGSSKDEEGIVAVRAVGDSMEDAGINPGDYVLIRFTDEAEDGDRVAAIIGDMVTVKRYKRQGGVTILYPESKNPKYKPIVLREDFKIAGKVLCVIPNPHAEYTEVVYE
ncbi:MAG TPA: transcriptional repressor LexA [Candidatus Paceibacterota bacterium]|nr:transcriptional repressor LexA [Candidatus Paceibacterota bacterium]